MQKTDRHTEVKTISQKTTCESLHIQCPNEKQIHSTFDDNFGKRWHIFLKILHWQIPTKIVSGVTTKLSTSHQLHCYNTLQNSLIQKSWWTFLLPFKI